MSAKSNTPVPSAEVGALEAALARVAALEAEAASLRAKAAKADDRPPLSLGQVAWIAANARPAETPCLCGCGGTTKTRFVPGHDARLKSALTRTAAKGGEPAELATRALARFGW